jgi:hypothetical protein
MEQNFFEETVTIWEVKNVPPFLCNWTVNYRVHTEVTQIHFNITLSTPSFPTPSLLFRFFEESVVGVIHFSCASNLSLPYRPLQIHRYDIWCSAVSIKSASM